MFKVNVHLFLYGILILHGSNVVRRQTPCSRVKENKTKQKNITQRKSLVFLYYIMHCYYLHFCTYKTIYINIAYKYLHQEHVQDNTKNPLKILFSLYYMEISPNNVKEHIKMFFFFTNNTPKHFQQPVPCLL